MQFSKIVAFGIATVLSFSTGAVAKCSGAKGILEDCCWGGNNGQDACNRQLGSITACFQYGDKDYCKNLGIPKEKCDADCCSISTGWGIGCPK